ncbi:MAG: hypothetical protein WA064_04350 [Candidatus Moraniibacteriota bacterium]
MLKKNKVKTESITVKILEKTLDQRFSEQDKRFDLRMDKRFNEYTGVILDALDSRFNRLEVQIEEIRADANDTRTLIDGYVKAQEDFKQEFVIMKEEIRQIKQVFKQKLGVEIRAF